MSFVSNVYIIKTLSTAKALTLQEGQVYRDISEMDICNDTYFTACFGEGAYACMDELQDTEALADATARFYELVMHTLMLLYVNLIIMLLLSKEAILSSILITK